MTDKREIVCDMARKSPEDESVSFQTYRLPYREGMTVLDVMRYVSDELDGTFAFYDHACKRGFCGSCLVKLDGKNSLSCRVPAPVDGFRLEPALKTAKDFWPTESE